MSNIKLKNRASGNVERKRDETNEHDDQRRPSDTWKRRFDDGEQNSNNSRRHLTTSDAGVNANSRHEHVSKNNDKQGVGKVRSKLKAHRRFNPISKKPDEGPTKSDVSSKVVKLKDGSGSRLVGHYSAYTKTSPRKVSRNDSKTPPEHKPSSVRTRKPSLEEIPMVVETDDVVAGVNYCRMQLEGGEQFKGELLQWRQEFANEEPMDVVVANLNKLYVVLDTNVLLGDLLLLDNIRKRKSGSSFPVTFIIPWVVLQELDLLKSDKHKKVHLKPLAIKAVRYVYDVLKRHDPQFRGQSAVESSDHLFKAESNDDRILQCCLQCKIKYDGEAIIFSNDRNLANKALVHSINVCSKADICDYLEKVLPIPDNSDKRVLQLKEMCGQIYKEWSNCVKDLMDVILTTEMKEIFEDVWLDIMYIKPPWTLKETFICVKKHWIAVFGSVVNRTAASIVDKLLEKTTKSSCSSDVKDLDELLNLSDTFLSHFKQRPTYGDHLRRVLEDIKKFKRRIEIAEKPPVSVNKTLSSAPCNSHSVTSQQPGSSIGSADQLFHSSVDFDIVKSAFDFIWNAINHSCGVIMDCFGVNHPIIYDRPPSLPTLSEANRFLSVFQPTLIRLKFQLSRVVTTDPSTSDGVAYEDLVNLLKNFTNLLGLQCEMPIKEEFTPEMLQKFSQNSKARELMLIGLHQLDYFVSLVNAQMH